MHQNNHSFIWCVPQVLLFELSSPAFKLVVNLWNQWLKSQPVQSHVFFLHQNIKLISVFSEVTYMSCQGNELKLCSSLQTDTDLQANRDRLVWRVNTSIDTHKRNSIKWGREERKCMIWSWNLSSLHSALGQLSHITGPVSQLAFTAHTLLKFNRLWEAAVSLQEVRVTVSLWLKAPTHLNTLKAWL